MNKKKIYLYIYLYIYVYIYIYILYIVSKDSGLSLGLLVQADAIKRRHLLRSSLHAETVFPSCGKFMA